MSANLPVATGGRTLRYARRLLSRYAARLVGTLALHLAAALVALAPPVLLGRIADRIAHGTLTSTGELGRLVACMALTVLVQTVLTWRALVATYTLSEHLLAELREDFLRRVTGLPLSTVERAGTGDLVVRTSSDTDVVSASMRNDVPPCVVNAITVVTVLVGALCVSPLLASAVLVVGPVLLGPLRWYLRRAPAAFADMQACQSDLAVSVAESADGVRTIESLGWQRRRADRLEREIERTRRVNMYALRLRSVLFPAMDFTVLIPSVITLLFGALLHAHGMATVGEVTTVVLLMQMLMTPVIQLIFSVEGLQRGYASLSRLVGVHMVPPDRRPTGRRPREEPHADIRLRGVRFGYTPDREVLRGIDLTLRRGERLALVGATGAGKSTLARILAGIHPPTGGSATVGGVPLVDLTQSQLRGRVVLLTQEHHVFVGTLADNLRMAAPHASETDMHRALAQIGDTGWVARLPEGLHSRLGGRDLTPTPGQAQQVALARLLLSSPATVILDEATSMMTPDDARGAESSLAALLAGRTVVAIAHRLWTAHDADRVGVMQDGRLVELGTHDELLAREGVYSRLWNAWQRPVKDRTP